ncbi:hypothetical protein DX933_05210 [Ornithinibacillus gellani]|uniref:YlbE-like family protein n=1 Tax=Ornithinibacillus gellani TaxID=2293253 RepID=UPI000F4A13A5|nr:YlbE-like family protein [Ornithinibacillus gellani]TQS75673.1 hypothetical protein DX933_05210 [Ornithinibacillus gellani]
MDHRVHAYLTVHPDLKTFVRHHPIWYRYLSRDPERMFELEKEAKVYFGKTIPQRMNKWNDRIHMLGMLFQFVEAMKD